MSLIAHYPLIEDFKDLCKTKTDLHDRIIQDGLKCHLDARDLDNDILKATETTEYSENLARLGSYSHYGPVKQGSTLERFVITKRNEEEWQNKVICISSIDYEINKKYRIRFTIDRPIVDLSVNTSNFSKTFSSPKTIIDETFVITDINNDSISPVTMHFTSPVEDGEDIVLTDFRIEEVVGVWKDRTNNHNDFKMIGFDYTETSGVIKSEGALKFDGVKSYCQCINNVDSENKTIQLKVSVQHDGQDDDQYKILFMDGSGSIETHGGLFIMGPYHLTSMLVRVYDKDGGYKEHVVGSLNNGDVITLIQNDGVLTLYFGNSKIFEQSVSPHITTLKPMLGWNSDSRISKSKFNTLLYYDRALTLEEVSLNVTALTNQNRFVNEGKLGRSLEMSNDNTQGGLVLDKNPIYNLDEWSISMWANWKSFSPNMGFFISRDELSSGTHLFWLPNKFRLMQNNACAFSDYVDISLNKWYNIIVTQRLNKSENLVERFIFNSNDQMEIEDLGDRWRFTPKKGAIGVSNVNIGFKMPALVDTPISDNVHINLTCKMNPESLETRDRDQLLIRVRQKHYYWTTLKDVNKFQTFNDSLCHHEITTDLNDYVLLYPFGFHELRGDEYCEVMKDFSIKIDGLAPTKELSLFLDNKEIIKIKDVPDNVGQLPDYMSIGLSTIGKENNHDNPFNGYLNDLRFYDNPLSKFERHQIQLCKVIHYPMVESCQPIRNYFPRMVINDLDPPGWDTSLHEGAKLVRFFSKSPYLNFKELNNSIGYNGGISKPEQGYHAMWNIENNTPVVVMRNCNASIGEPNRWLGVSIAIHFPRDLKIGDTVKVSFEQKSNEILGKFILGLYHKGKTHPDTNTFNGGCRETAELNDKIYDWQRRVVTFNITEDFIEYGDGVTCFLYLYAHDNDEGCIMKAKNIQVEMSENANEYIRDIDLDRPLVDVSGYNNNGYATEIAPRVTEDSFSKWYQFEKDRHLYIPRLHLQEFTISFWFKRGMSIPFSDSKEVILSAGPYGFILKLDRDTHKIKVSTMFNGSLESEELETNTIYKVVITFELGTGWKLFINGLLTGSTSAGSKLVYEYGGYSLGYWAGDKTSSNFMLTDFRQYATAIKPKDIEDEMTLKGAIDTNGTIHVKDIKLPENLLEFANDELKSGNIKYLRKTGWSNTNHTFENGMFHYKTLPNCGLDGASKNNWGGLYLNNRSIRILKPSRKYLYLYEFKGETSNWDGNENFIPSIYSIYSTYSISWSTIYGLPSFQINRTYTNKPSTIKTKSIVNWVTASQIFETKPQVYTQTTREETAHPTYTQYPIGTYLDIAKDIGLFITNYHNTGDIGEDIWIKNLRLYDITGMDEGTILSNIGSLSPCELILDNEEVNINKFNEVSANDIHTNL